MDVNLLRTAVTVVAFLLFAGIVVWAYRPTGRHQFEEAARLPFPEGE
jgi:cytochrome c oxidase cbb3-type subunit 4